MSTTENEPRSGVEEKIGTAPPAQEPASPSDAPATAKPTAVPAAAGAARQDEPTLQELLDEGLVHPLVRQALDAAKDKAREAEERMLRALAETENQRKRMQRDLEDRVRFANETLLLEMLPVLDNLERSLLHAGDGASIKDLRTGVELTLSQFRRAFEGVGVQAVTVAPGVPFDPAVHEAVMQDDEADLPERTVARVVQSGFRYRERVLRPARVVVASGRGRKTSPETTSASCPSAATAPEATTAPTTEASNEPQTTSGQDRAQAG